MSVIGMNTMITSTTMTKYTTLKYQIILWYKQSQRSIVDDIAKQIILHLCQFWINNTESKNGCQYNFHGSYQTYQMSQSRDDIHSGNDSPIVGRKKKGKKITIVNTVRKRKKIVITNITTKFNEMTGRDGRKDENRRDTRHSNSRKRNKSKRCNQNGKKTSNQLERAPKLSVNSGKTSNASNSQSTIPRNSYHPHTRW